MRLPAPVVDKHRTQYRRTANFVAIPFEVALTLGTLANNATLTADLLASDFDDDIYMISVDCAFGLEGQTAGEGPIHVGIAHSDYTDAEIQEYLDVDPTERHDKIAQERVKRGAQIRKFGRFGIGTEGGPNTVLANGTLQRKPLKFVVNEGKTLSVYATNRGVGNTTGREVKASGTIYGRWLH